MNKSGDETSSKFVFHVIELSKLEETSEEEKKSSLYRWARMIAARSWEAARMEAEGNPYMEEALDEMDKINQSEMERYLYLRREMAISDENSRLATAENKGREKGKQEGEKTKAYHTAENMYARGYTVEEAAAIIEEDISVVEKWYKEWETGNVNPVKDL